MADIYDRGRVLAIRQLALRANGGKGAVLVLGRMVDPDPTDPNSVPAPTNYTGSGIRTRYSRMDVDGTTILADDVRMLVSPVLANGADMPKPVNGDTLQFDGDTYMVIGSTPWDYVGLQIGFVVQARKG